MDHGNVDFCLYSLQALCLTLKCLSWHFLRNFTKIFPRSCDKWDFHLSPLDSSVWVSIDHTHLKEKGQGIPQMVLGQYPEEETRAEKDLEEQMLENWHNYPIAPNSLS